MPGMVLILQGVASPASVSRKIHAAIGLETDRARGREGQILHVAGEFVATLPAGVLGGATGARIEERILGCRNYRVLRGLVSMIGRARSR